MEHTSSAPDTTSQQPPPWPAHIKEVARLSLAYTQYKQQDDLRDPLDALRDAEMLLAEASRIYCLLTDFALHHSLGKRLEWVLRNPADAHVIATAQLLVEHNRKRCADLGILDPVTNRPRIT